jgi:hypothetical protein
MNEHVKVGDVKEENIAMAAEPNVEYKIKCDE